MVSRTIQQLNLPIAGEYCCRNDYDLTMEHVGAGMLALVGDSLERPSVVNGISFWELVSITKRIGLRQELTKQLEAGDEVELMMPICRKDGREIWVLNRGRKIIGDGGEHIVGVLVEAGSLKQERDELKNKLEQYQLKLSQTQDIVSVLEIRAEQDSLTGLYNASATRRLAEEYLSGSDQGNCALLMIDVDHFKQVNDRCGHMVGDQMLIRAAAIIKKLFRSQDVVGRVGGDEFLVLMKDVPSSEIAYKRCMQLVNAFHEITDEHLPNGVLSCSVGVALSAVCGNSYQELFCCADRALYRVKGNGGNQFMIYDVATFGSDEK